MIMTKKPSKNEYFVQEKEKDFNHKLERWLVTIACLSYFPLAYLIGKAIIEWLQ